MSFSINNLPKSNDITITGQLRTGVRCCFVDKNNWRDIRSIIPRDKNKVEYLLNSKNSKDSNFIISSNTGFVTGQNKILGWNGRRKFYYLLDEDPHKGIYIFVNLVKDKNKQLIVKIKKYIRVMQSYYRLGVCPKVFSWCRVHFNCIIKRHTGKKIIVKRTCVGVVTQKIQFPQYLFDITKDKDREIANKIINNKKFCPVSLNKQDMKYMYGINFCRKNPKFCVSKLANFKISVRKAIQRNIKHLKYGNILYCTNKKKWYLIDLD